MMAFIKLLLQSNTGCVPQQFTATIEKQRKMIRGSNAQHNRIKGERARTRAERERKRERAGIFQYLRNLFNKMCTFLWKCCAFVFWFFSVFRSCVCVCLPMIQQECNEQRSTTEVPPICLFYSCYPSFQTAFVYKIQFMKRFGRSLMDTHLFMSKISSQFHHKYRECVRAFCM